MSTNISEGLPARKKAAPVVDAPKGGQESGGKKGGTAENSAKRIRQAVYDIRYRARREDIDLKQAFSQYMSNTCLLYTSPSPRDVEESRMPSSA